MGRYTHDVIIVGGGAAGLTTTVGCASLGLKTLLVEKSALGGDCLFHGCVPSKTLLHTASLYRSLQEFPAYGLPSVASPAVDMSAVNARIQSVIARIQEHDSPARFKSLGAEVTFGAARFISPNQMRLEHGETVSAPHIVLATGSRPRSVPIPGLEESGYLTNLDMFSLSEVPGHLLILGAGPIGVEMAEAYLRLGSRITLVDMAPTIVPVDDPELSAIVASRLEREGAAFRLGVNVTRAEKTVSGVKLHIRKDEVEESLTADALLLAVGRTGNIEELDAPQAGIRTEGGFVVTDSKLRTSARHILAVGDCNGRYLFTHVAGAEGAVAVRRVALRLGGSMNYHRVPWVTYTDPELASVGYSEKSAAEEGINVDVIRTPFSTNDRAEAEGAQDGLMKTILDRKGRIIGTQIAGSHAGELLAPALFSTRFGWKPGKISGTIFPYPTLSEIHRKAASDALSPKLFNDRMRRLLKLLFRYRGTAGR